MPRGLTKDVKERRTSKASISRSGKSGVSPSRGKAPTKQSKSTEKKSKSPKPQRRATSQRKAATKTIQVTGIPTPEQKQTNTTQNEKVDSIEKDLANEMNQYEETKRKKQDLDILLNKSKKATEPSCKDSKIRFPSQLIFEDNKSPLIQANRDRASFQSAPPSKLTNSSGNKESEPNALNRSLLRKRTNNQRFDSTTSYLETYFENKDLIKMSKEILSKLDNFLKSKKDKRAYEISGLLSSMVDVKTISSYLIRLSMIIDINNPESLKTHFLTGKQISQWKEMVSKLQIQLGQRLKTDEQLKSILSELMTAYKNFTDNDLNPKRSVTFKSQAEILSYDSASNTSIQKVATKGDNEQVNMSGSYVRISQTQPRGPIKVRRVLQQCAPGSNKFVRQQRVLSPQQRKPDPLPAVEQPTSPPQIENTMEKNKSTSQKLVSVLAPRESSKSSGCLSDLIPMNSINNCADDAQLVQSSPKNEYQFKLTISLSRQVNVNKPDDFEKQHDQSFTDYYCTSDPEGPELFKRLQKFSLKRSKRQ